MKLSVIVPVHNGGKTLGRCLEALTASSYSPDEIIVVDDASTDESVRLARQFNAKVLDIEFSDGLPCGPACARNRGAEIAQGAILLFVDADVAVHVDTLEKVLCYFERKPEISALFGSYDADPPAGGLVSQYKNLLHHYVHQMGRREAGTFWAGCGAIRGDVFQAIGGFKTAYRRASIEDIELGARLRQAGHTIWLCPDIQATHLKHWTLGRMLRSDIFDRAIPWSRLIHGTRRYTSDLNLNTQGRMSAVLAWSSLFLTGLGRWWPYSGLGALASVAMFVVINANLYRFFARRRGIVFTVIASVLHFIYFLYSSLIFALMAVSRWIGQR